MGVLDRFRRRDESRAIDKMALWARGDDIGYEVHAGVEVTQSSALRLIAVYAAVRLIAETIASLPADVMHSRDGASIPVGRPPGWLKMPNPETTWFEFVERILGSLLLDGNAFIAITGRNATGYPAELWTLNPTDVRVIRRTGGNIVFVWGGDEMLTRYGPANPAGDVLHIKAFSAGGLRGLSPIEIARQGIGLGLVAEKFGARFFGAGTSLSGVIQMPLEARRLTDEHIDQMRRQWEETHAGSGMSHRPGVLTGGAEWKPLSIPPDDAQFLETRGFQVAEIARLFRVPPHLIGDVERSTSWGTGIEQQSIGFVQFSLTPWLVRLEHAFNQLTPAGQFMKWNTNGLLRGDMAARATFYHNGITDGWMTRADARALEDMPPLDGLEEPLVSTSLTTMEQLEAEPEPAFEPVPTGGEDDAVAS